MGRYEEYIKRLCKNRGITPEQAKELALSREVQKYYREDNGEDPVMSTYNPLGECT